MASFFGLGFAQYESLTGDFPYSHVAFAHPPGIWVDNNPAGWDVEWWLVRNREVLRPGMQFGHDTNETTRWVLRTRMTLAAFAAGLVCGCLLFRPWRRGTAPATSP